MFFSPVSVRGVSIIFFMCTSVSSFLSPRVWRAGDSSSAHLDSTHREFLLLPVQSAMYKNQKSAPRDVFGTVVLACLPPFPPVFLDDGKPVGFLLAPPFWVLGCLAVLKLSVVMREEWLILKAVLVVCSEKCCDCCEGNWIAIRLEALLGLGYAEGLLCTVDVTDGLVTAPVAGLTAGLVTGWAIRMGSTPGFFPCLASHVA